MPTAPTPNDTVYAVAGIKVYIGTTKAISKVDDATALTDYKADTWQEIKPVQDIGDFGDVAEEIKFTAIGDKRVRRRKGALDGGTWDITVGRNSTDLGQVAVRAAAKTGDTYNFKIVLTDTQTVGTGTPTMIYLQALVMSAKNKLGQVNETILQVFTLGVTSSLVEDLAT